ncbi:unnamed protein product [Gongylonema pulchrum]|uniref:CW-type domain-containing protein n=1 Tax=Gongylonema pulchrum TaxID=637853 RepID=A0A183DI47_9BILA|nr:unnamed protein product [Gongylonema pulchrum]
MKCCAIWRRLVYADIGKGYLDRWCIDPLDPGCPKESPNHFPFCDLIPRFLQYAEQEGFEVPVDPDYLKRKKREVEGATNDTSRDLGTVRGTVEFPVKSFGNNTDSEEQRANGNDEIKGIENGNGVEVPDITGRAESTTEHPNIRRARTKKEKGWNLSFKFFL